LGKREHDGKTHLTIKVAEVTLQGGKSDGGRDERQDQRPQSRDDLEDSIPF
jgi:hypothetical protein